MPVRTTETVGASWPRFGHIGWTSSRLAEPFLKNQETVIGRSRVLRVDFGMRSCEMLDKDSIRR